MSEHKSHLINHSEYNKNLKNISRTLRKNMTPEEKHLWYDFLSKHTSKFYRQRAIGNYVADFYCPKLKLVIEIDGSQHYTTEGKEYDAKRTAVLNQRDIVVLRYTNLDITDNFQSVCNHIDNTIDNLVEKSSLKNKHIYD